MNISKLRDKTRIGNTGFGTWMDMQINTLANREIIFKTHDWCSAWLFGAFLLP